MSTTDHATAGYIDLYLLPVPEDKLDAYRVQATIFGTVAREHGALSYREFLADDLGEGWGTPPDTVQTSAVVEFTSREHRDEVMTRVLADPRVTALMDGEQPAVMEAMRYGGFGGFVRC